MKITSRQLGHGGVAYVAELLECSTRTITRGMNELDQLADDPAASRVRRPGAGRKKVVPESEVEQNLQSLIKTRTAGDPDDPLVLFTDLAPTRIEQELEAMGTSPYTAILRR